MSGYIFLCDNVTERECLKRLLFGTNNAKVYAQYFQKIQIGDWLFLFNYQQRTLRGLYRAVSVCGKDIETDAWKDMKGYGFPYQVRVAADGEYSAPLSVNEIQQIISLSHTKIGQLPPSQIPTQKVLELVHALQKKNDDFTPVTVRVPKEQLNSRAYIFRCSRETGGKCFDDNVMGAPVSLFKSIVSHIQSGDTIFLWLIEERKIYGVWRAKSRGQYDPVAFGGDFSAVVYCERPFALEKGLPENIVRGIVPYDRNMPPYRIKHEQSQALVDALLSVNAESDDSGKDNGDRKYLCEDGHLVRSYSEIIIDNWLFNHQIVHAYEHRMQLGSSFLRCDFYIPTKRVFVEFWGMIGDPKYDARRKRKKEMYSQAGVNLLEVFPMDIPVLSEVLPAKLAQFGISVLGSYSNKVSEIPDHRKTTERQNKPPTISTQRPEPPKIKPEGVQSTADEKPAGSREADVYTYRIKAYGVVARMVIRNNSYVVLKGSTATTVTNASMSIGHKRKKQELINSGKLVREPRSDLYVFTCDVEFNSPSEASGVISGSSTNGWQCFGIPSDRRKS